MDMSWKFALMRLTWNALAAQCEIIIHYSEHTAIPSASKQTSLLINSVLVILIVHVFTEQPIMFAFIAVTECTL